LFNARRQAQVLVVLSPSLPTWQWTKWVKSEGRQNGFDLVSKMPLQAELLPAADIFLRYLCHFDAAKVDLSGPDPKLYRRIV
jgi:hypothetical protein